MKQILLLFILLEFNLFSQTNDDFILNNCFYFENRVDSLKVQDTIIFKLNETKKIEYFSFTEIGEIRQYDWRSKCVNKKIKKKGTIRKQHAHVMTMKVMWVDRGIWKVENSKISLDLMLWQSKYSLIEIERDQNSITFQITDIGKRF